MYERRKGISLIVLVITILVMIILAGVVIVSLQKNNPVEKAKEATFKTNIVSMIEKLNMYTLNNNIFDSKELTLKTKEEMSKVFTDFTKEQLEDFEVFEGNLYKTNVNDLELSILDVSGGIKFTTSKKSKYRYGLAEGARYEGENMILPPDPIQPGRYFPPTLFGPIVPMKKGKYEVVITGNNLNYLECACYDGGVATPKYNFKEIEKKNDILRIEVDVTEDTKDLEVVFRNYTNGKENVEIKINNGIYYRKIQ